MKKQTSIILPIVVVVVAALAFAAWRMWDVKEREAAPWPEIDGGVYAQAVHADGLDYLVPPNEVYSSGLTTDDRPALTDPKFDDITTADNKLADDLEGIAVSVGDTHRFYPFQILNWHEVVNTEVNGVSLVVTYSPLTGSAVVYEDERHFHDANQIYNNAMLMQAEGDDTLWNQTTGQAVVGKTVGEFLKMYPSTVMSWATWKDLYPGGLALSTDTGFARDYGRHPYANYESSKNVYFPLNHTFGQVMPKELVYRVEAVPGISQPGVYLDSYLRTQKDPNLTVGSEDATRQIVAFYDEEHDIVRAYLRLVEPNPDTRDGEFELTFENNNGVITDTQTGSRWSPEGVAVSGELRGTTLIEVPVTRHYAFAQFAMYPASIISGQDLLPAEDVREPDNSLLIN